MGLKSSPHSELTFGAHDPAVGYPGGRRHTGIAQMFTVIEQAAIPTLSVDGACRQRVPQFAAFAKERCRV